MALRGDVGAQVALPVDLDPFVALFSESAGRAVVVVRPDDAAALDDLCEAHGVPVTRLGAVGGAALVVEGQFEVAVAELREAWTATFPALFGPTVG